VSAKNKLLIWGAVLGGLAIMSKFSNLGSGAQSVVERMAEAIKAWESGGNPSAKSFRNNNPGNLKYAGQAGVTGTDEQGHAIFETFEAGWQALLNQLSIAFTGSSRVYSPDDTLYEFFHKYAEANSENYAEYVAAALGVSPDTALRNITT
jgi:hypothetical protein